MSRYQRDNRPYVPKIQHVEVKDGSYALRVALLIAAIGLAVFAFGYALNTALTPEVGWQEIEVSTTTAAAQEISLQYYFGEEKGTADRKRQVTSLYSETLAEADNALSWEVVEGVTNLHSLSMAPNQELTVGKTLYAALEAFLETGSRGIYYAPLYSRYNALFACGNDEDAALYDPEKSPEAGDFVSEVLNYVSQDSQIHLELLGENRVRLFVSDTYRAFVEENEITELLDFGILKNAFVMDAVATALEENGLTEGILTSREGYARCLGNSYGNVNLLEFNGGNVRQAATATYMGPKAVAALRGFPVQQEDYSFYTYGDGTVRPPYVEEATGLLRCEHENLVLFGDGAVGPLAVRAVQAMTQPGTPDGDCLYSQDKTVFCTVPSVQISNLYEGYRLSE